MQSFIKPQYQFPLAASESEALTGFERLYEALSTHPPHIRSRVEGLLMHPPHHRFLSGVFGCSPHLTNLIIRHLDFFSAFADASPEALFAVALEEIKAVDTADTTTLKKALRVAKGKASLVIALADLGGVWSLAEVTRCLSTLAEESLKTATDFLLLQAAAKGQIEITDPQNPSANSGLVILGMGKLGGFELNYSSDIDIIVFFESGKAGLTENISAQKFFVRLTQDLTAILHDRTEDGYVFRVDLRLRPDPASTPVAISTSGALTYYETVGQNWERAAMIKARPVAGDIEAGEYFLNQLRPYVWRKNLDYAALRDIHSIKRQMDARQDKQQNDFNAYNVKLGRGGIREIEFFAQTQQLIWGGRQPLLRVRGTCDALAALTTVGHILEETRAILADNYLNLRILEHRLQMVADEQTHSLPATSDGILRTARFCGLENNEALEAKLKNITASTSRIYSELFKESPTLSHGGNLVFTGVENDTETLNTLRSMGFVNPDYVSTVIRAWHHGGRRSTRTKRARELITELMPDILRNISKSPDPDATFKLFDDFVAKAPAVSQIFSIFSANPKLLDLLLMIMSTSPWLGSLIARKSSLLETLLEPGFFNQFPKEPQIKREIQNTLKIEPDFENRMNLLRKFIQEKQLQIGVHLLKKFMTPAEAAKNLSILADCAVANCVEAARMEFEEKYGRFSSADFAVIAFGKYGGGELRLGADLDIIFVYDAKDENEYSNGNKAFLPNVYYMRLAQRIISALSIVGDEGKLYDVDTRLRPYGLKGPVAVSLDGLDKYYQTAAWPIEFLSLTRARVVHTGSTQDFENKINSVILAALMYRRDYAALKQQALDVREKIEKKTPAKSCFDVKYVRGGLVDIELAVQFLYLTELAEINPVLHTATLSQLDSIRLNEPQKTRIASAINVFSAFQMYGYLFSSGTFDESDSAIAREVAQSMGASGIHELKSMLEECQAEGYNFFSQVFSGDIYG